MPRFHSRLTHPLPTAGDMWRILRTGGFRPPKGALDRLGEVPRSEPPSPWPAPDPTGLALTWVGHATFIVEIGGLRILTDPVWSPRLPGYIPRLSPPGVALDALPPIDAAVVSHDHYDHLDAWTWRRLPKGIKVFAPLGHASWFRRKGFRDVAELDWWQTSEHKGVRFSLVPAHHWCRRTPWDTNRRLWGGWVVEGGGRKAFHAGDTAYGPWFKEIGRRHPGIDVAMLPIGAYEPRWFMQKVHMDPAEAVQAWGDLGAGRLATMHWATYPLTREPVMEPLEKVRTAWPEEVDRERLWDLALGERRGLGDPSRS